MANVEKETEQAQIWEQLYERLRALLLTLGSEDYRETADCWVDDDNLGTPQQKVYIRNLSLLRPAVVASLQRLLADFPEWEIMVGVSVPGQGRGWPSMGLTIRAHEIVDGLQRQYFPKSSRILSMKAAGVERIAIEQTVDKCAWSARSSC